MAYRVEAWKRERRQCVWVFDIGGQRAVYFIRGNRYRYRGDAAPLMNASMNRFHLKPAHAELVLSDTLAPIYRPVDSLPLYVFCGKKILFIENSWKFNVPPKKLAVDLVVLSRNARMSIQEIDSVFASRQYVADASNGLWKTEQWENECEELHLPCHIIQKKGAFYYDIE